jgi:hypothetical protein
LKSSFPTAVLHPSIYLFCPSIEASITLATCFFFLLKSTQICFSTITLADDGPIESQQTRVEVWDREIGEVTETIKMGNY